MLARLAKGKVYDKNGSAVVIAVNKAKVDRASIVYCLKLRDISEDNSVHVEDFEGSPFRLDGHDCIRPFIWCDICLRQTGIEVGSVISFKKLYRWFQRDTGIKVDVHKAISSLQFRNGDHRVGFGQIVKESRDASTCMETDVSETPLIPCYKMTKNPHGYCLIINNLCFDKETEEDRRGAEFDESAAHQLFCEELHFAVHVKNDLQYFEIQQVLEEFAAKDHSDCDAFICIIMSHGGERDTIFGIKGKPIGIETLMSEYTATNCPTLADKPKVFIIQACRGPSEDPFMRSADQGLCTDSSVAKFSRDSTLCRSTTPSEIDFLLAFSTVPGYISYRNKESGTLFIQTLVEVIRKYHSKVHLADMLTMVTNHVAERGSQVPQPSTTLRASLYL